MGGTWFSGLRVGGMDVGWSGSLVGEISKGRVVCLDDEHVRRRSEELSAELSERRARTRSRPRSRGAAAACERAGWWRSRAAFVRERG